MANVSSARAVCLTLVLSLFCSEQAVSRQTTEQPLTAVADLRYGAALFQYYQGKHLEALSELMVARERGGIKGHGDNPELMQGGFHLAYGMERKAADIFERLLAANRSEDIQNAAWFYLARLRYLRGDFDATDEAISRIHPEPTAKLALELRVLQINLALRRGNLELATQLYQHKSLKNSDWVPYLQYNFGAAYGRAGQFDQSIRYYNTLLTITQRSEEFLTLYDKAMTAAGYAYLLNQNYPESIARFSQVRLNSTMSNPALLGYGWAATEMEDYRGALKPWNVLANRSLIDENTQEALIAIPFAYEKMDFEGRALEHYRLAEKNFTEEIAKLDTVIGSMQGYAIREALNIDRSEDFNWLNYTQKNNLSPQVTYLIELFSKDAFIGLVQELRDLLAIQETLAGWQQKLDFYAAMLKERDENRASEMQILSGKNLESNIAAMEQQRDELAKRIAKIEREYELTALLNEEESEQFDRLVNAERHVQTIAGDRSVLGTQIDMDADTFGRAQWEVRALKGTLLWNASEKFSERLWRVKKQLAQLNQTIEHNRRLQANIQNVVSQGFDLQPYRSRIDDASEKLLIQTVDVELAIENAQNDLRKAVVGVLQQQRERLFHYMALSRLSIARILDLAAKKQQEAQPNSQQSDTQSDASAASDDAAAPIAGDNQAVGL